MAIVYRTDDGSKWGVGKGANLTAAEVDDNFWDHDQRISAIESTPPAATSIASITQSGSALTVHLSDGTTQGPFDLPGIPFNFTGAWQASHAYAVGDLFTESNRLYAVIYAHTSGTTFDASASDGLGHSYYALVLDMGAVSVPPPSTKSGTTYTLVSADANGYLRCTNASGCTVTVPTGAALPIAVGSEYHFRQAAAGAITFTPDTGVTINKPTGYDAATGVQGATVTLKKVAANEWDLFGLLAVTP